MWIIKFDCWLLDLVDKPAKWLQERGYRLTRICLYSAVIYPVMFAVGSYLSAGGLVGLAFQLGAGIPSVAVGWFVVNNYDDYPEVARQAEFLNARAAYFRTVPLFVSLRLLIVIMTFSLGPVLVFGDGVARFFTVAGALLVVVHLCSQSATHLGPGNFGKKVKEQVSDAVPEGVS